MEINRNIVATRKLNKENKARLGRGGDTKIREVAGRDSHVNALEAYLIDVDRKAGEDYAKRVGAGTTNPLTGMPEYHKVEPVSEHPDTHTHGTKEGDAGYGTYPDYDNEIPTAAGRAAASNLISASGIDYSTFKGELTFEQIKNLTSDQRAEYLQQNYGLSAGGDYERYFTDVQDQPFTFIGEEQELITGAIGPDGLPIDPTTGTAGKARGFTERGLKSTYGATMGGLASQQAALDRTAGRGLGQAAGTARAAASKSGLATSRSITQGYETQKKELLQDYTAGIGDIRRERGTALETLTLGQDVAGADYQSAIAGASLDFRQSTYAEEQRQKELFYDEIGAINPASYRPG